MNLKELNKSLGKSNKLILIGEEQYLVDYAIARLKKQLMPEFEIFNYIELNQERDNFQDCITKLESVPMMDLKKLVVIKKFVFAADNHPWNKTQLKIFKESVEKLSEDTTLVLTNDSVSKPANLKLIKEYSSLMNLVVLGPLDQANLMQFMKEYLGSSMPKEHIKMDALAYLVGASEYSNRGSKISLYDVKGMLDKVLAYYREFGTFTSKDAAMLFEQKLEGSVFKIVDAIAANNKSLAFSHYYALKEKGEASMKIMITIGKLFSTMVKASYYFDEGYNYQDVATELKKSEWNIKSGRSTYQKIGRLALIDMIDQILEVDYMMKTGQLVESMYGEMALMRIFQVRER